MGWDSSIEARRASIISLSSKLYTMCSRMSRSLTKPRARKMMKMGTSDLMYGMVARTTWPAPLWAVALDSILTPIVLVFLVLFSRTDLSNGNNMSLVFMGFVLTVFLLHSSSSQYLDLLFEIRTVNL